MQCTERVSVTNFTDLTKDFEDNDIENLSLCTLISIASNALLEIEIKYALVKN